MENFDLKSSASFFENYLTWENESLLKAKKMMNTLLDLSIKEKGEFKEPIMIGMQGKPGLGKSHIL